MALAQTSATKTNTMDNIQENLASTLDHDSKQVIEGYQLFGTVKEIGVDDRGLQEFYTTYFPFPLYKDDNLVFYNHLFGKSKISLSTYNPFKLYKGYQEMKKRLNEKKLEGNYAGEGMVKGGVVIFDKEGQVRYVYPEETGSPLDIGEIVQALKEISKE